MTDIIKEIRDLQAQLSNYKILEHNKHLRLVGNKRTFERINYWIDSDYDTAIKLARIKALVMERQYPEEENGPGVD